MLMNLYHAFELLLIHGAGVFVHYCLGKILDEKSILLNWSKFIFGNNLM